MEQVSPQVRLIALLGLAAAVLGGAAMTFMGRGGDVSSEPLPPPAMQAALAGAQEISAAASGRAAEVAAATGEAEPAAAAKPAAKPKPKPKPLVDANGLPMSIATALRRHDVVVVSLYTPGGGTDAVALEEARAGAQEAGAGFVAVNVLDRRQGGPLARLLGVQEPPAVLVYRAPSTLAFRLEGFADLTTVAEAAAGART